jgi:transcriptional regulator with XRE-family HTH domain
MKSKKEKKVKKDNREISLRILQESFPMNQIKTTSKDKIIGALLKYIRDDACLSQKEMGERLGGISAAYISNIENGKCSLSDARIESIYNALGELGKPLERVVNNLNTYTNGSLGLLLNLNSYLSVANTKFKDFEKMAKEGNIEAHYLFPTDFKERKDERR